MYISVRIGHYFCSVFRSYHVSSQVDAEDGDGPQGQRDIDDNEEQEGGDLRDVAGQGVRN